MKPSVKSTIIILVTLLIGIGIGFEISEIKFSRRFEHMRELRQANGFVNFFDDVIQPTQEQKKTINPILLNFHDHIEKVAEGNFQRIRLIMDSLKTEVSPMLTKDQADRLAKRMEEMRIFQHGKRPSRDF